MFGLISMIAMWRYLRFRFDCDDGYSRASKMFREILAISNVSNRHGTTRKRWLREWSVVYCHSLWLIGHYRGIV
jgi:hypothetical protein